MIRLRCCMPSADPPAERNFPKTRRLPTNAAYSRGAFGGPPSLYVGYQQQSLDLARRCSPLDLRPRRRNLFAHCVYVKTQHQSLRWPITFQFGFSSLGLSGPNRLRQHRSQPSTASMSMFHMPASTNIASPTRMSELKGPHPDQFPLLGSVLRRVLWVASVHIAKVAGDAENQMVRKTGLARYRR